MAFYMYNIFMELFKLVVKIGQCSWTQWLTKAESKARKFIMGQKGIISHIKAQMANEQRDVVWVHCASLGEYAVARSVIKGLRTKGYSVVLTLFSPSGYEPLHKRSDVADYVFYLPIDTIHHATQFLDIVKPKKAIFVISEYWINYLRQLRKRNIPTYIISMQVPHTSYLLKWYAYPLRQALKAVTTFLVLNEESKKNMARKGFNNCRVIGDPLFDNALQIAGVAYHNTIIENFCNSATEVFVAGSISDINDLKIVSSFANKHPQLKFILVPHEICEENLNAIIASLDGKAYLYSDCNSASDFSTVQSLIIDYLGDLPYIYRFGKYAYVGGGFTPYLHSVIEPVSYGLPIAFGPNIHRKVIARQMIDDGFASIVKTTNHLEKWFNSIQSSRYEDLHRKALDFARSNAGATKDIMRTIVE